MMAAPLFPNAKVEKSAYDETPLSVVSFAAMVCRIMKRKGADAADLKNYTNDVFLTDRDILEVTAEYVVLV